MVTRSDKKKLKRFKKRYSLKSLGKDATEILNSAQRVLERENVKLIESILKINRNIGRLKKKYFRLARAWKSATTCPMQLKRMYTVYDQHSVRTLKATDLDKKLTQLDTVIKDFEDQAGVISQLKRENLYLHQQKRHAIEYKRQLKEHIKKFERVAQLEKRRIQSFFNSESERLLASVVNQLQSEKTEDLKADREDLDMQLEENMSKLLNASSKNTQEEIDKLRDQILNTIDDCAQTLETRSREMIEFNNEQAQEAAQAETSS